MVHMTANSGNLAGKAPVTETIIKERIIERDLQIGPNIYHVRNDDDINRINRKLDNLIDKFKRTKGV